MCGRTVCYTRVQRQSLPSIFSSDIEGRELKRWAFKIRFWAEELVQLVVLAWETQGLGSRPSTQRFRKKGKKGGMEYKCMRILEASPRVKGIKVKPRTNTPKHPTPWSDRIWKKIENNLKTFSQMNMPAKPHGGASLKMDENKANPALLNYDPEGNNFGVCGKLKQLMSGQL